MFNKIFLALFIIGLLAMGGMVFSSNNWLYSIGKPEDAVANHEFYKGVGWQILWVSSLILLILANVILWTSKKSWPLWLTFGYFALFILLNTWWLSENLSSFQKIHKLPSSGYFFSGIFGAILCVVVGIGVFFDQFIVLRLQDKMFNKPGEQTEVVAQEKAEEIVEEKSEENTEETTVEKSEEATSEETDPK